MNEKFRETLILKQKYPDPKIRNKQTISWKGVFGSDFYANIF